MPSVSNLLGLTVETLLHLSIVGTRKEDIAMRRWRALLDQSVELNEFGDVLAINATGIDRV